ncbi:MAG: hypothetical protein N2C14_19180, partial [Planctomycetales bacterium]
MTQITLVVTGNLEKHSLGTSLKTVFPDVEFETQKTDCFTSSKVTRPPDNLERPRTNAEEMAALLVQ